MLWLYETKRNETVLMVCAIDCMSYANVLVGCDIYVYIIFGRLLVIMASGEKQEQAGYWTHAYKIYKKNMAFDQYLIPLLIMC